MEKELESTVTINDLHSKLTSKGIQHEFITGKEIKDRLKELAPNAYSVNTNSIGIEMKKVIAKIDRSRYSEDVVNKVVKFESFIENRCKSTRCPDNSLARLSDTDYYVVKQSKRTKTMAMIGASRHSGEFVVYTSPYDIKLVSINRYCWSLDEAVTAFKSTKFPVKKDVTFIENEFSKITKEKTEIHAKFSVLKVLCNGCEVIHSEKPEELQLEYFKLINDLTSTFIKECK